MLNEAVQDERHDKEELTLQCQDFQEEAVSWHNFALVQFYTCVTASNPVRNGIAACKLPVSRIGDSCKEDCENIPISMMLGNEAHWATCQYVVFSLCLTQFQAHRHHWQSTRRSYTFELVHSISQVCSRFPKALHNEIWRTCGFDFFLLLCAGKG